MPELPDIAIYLESLEKRILGERLVKIRIANPFLLRTFDPPIESAEQQVVRELRRLGKRIVIGLENDCWLVLHLMIAGRLHWEPVNKKIPAKRGLAAFDFDAGTLLLTEAGTKRRASLHLLRSESSLAELDRGGIEPLEVSAEEFSVALKRENHTLKRTLTDPRLFSGIGNAYSDEILHRAQLSPLAQTKRLTQDRIERLYHATREVLLEWTERVRAETGDGFPKKVTAFREGMAAHGRFGQPCPVCKTTIQRIRYAENETNYCPRCQTGGKILADRSLSRLLKDDWPRTLEELEEL